jgi:hypothetical protein
MEWSPAGVGKDAHSSSDALIRWISPLDFGKLTNEVDKQKVSDAQ